MMHAWDLIHISPEDLEEEDWDENYDEYEEETVEWDEIEDWTE